MFGASYLEKNSKVTQWLRHRESRQFGYQFFQTENAGNLSKIKGFLPVNCSFTDLRIPIFFKQCYVACFLLFPTLIYFLNLTCKALHVMKGRIVKM